MRPELAQRIVWEAQAVRAKFPGRFGLTTDRIGRPAWRGSVPAEGREFPVTVSYPAAYPGLPPIVKTPVALPADCPHLLDRSGEEATLCWIAPNARLRRRRWDPQRHTAATALRAAQRWFLAFLVWKTLDVWPVADAWDLERFEMDVARERGAEHSL